MYCKFLRVDVGVATCQQSHTDTTDRMKIVVALALRFSKKSTLESLHKLQRHDRTSMKIHINGCANLDIKYKIFS